MNRFATTHPELELAFNDDLRDLVSLCEKGSCRTVLERAEIVRTLLIESRDPFIHRALVQTLLPGLIQVCRDLRFGSGIFRDPSEFMSQAVSILSELIIDWAGQSRQYAAGDILSATRCRLTRSMMREKVPRSHVSLSVTDDVVTHENSSLLTRLEALRGEGFDREVDLVYRVVFFGDSMTSLASSTGSDFRSLQRELREFSRKHLI